MTVSKHPPRDVFAIVLVEIGTWVVHVHTLPPQYKITLAFKSNTKGELPTKEEFKRLQNRWMLLMR